MFKTKFNEKMYRKEYELERISRNIFLSRNNNPLRVWSSFPIGIHDRKHVPMIKNLHDAKNMRGE